MTCQGWSLQSWSSLTVMIYLDNWPTLKNLSPNLEAKIYIQHNLMPRNTKIIFIFKNNCYIYHFSRLFCLLTRLPLLWLKPLSKGCQLSNFLLWHWQSAWHWVTVRPALEKDQIKYVSTSIDQKTCQPLGSKGWFLWKIN